MEAHCRANATVMKKVQTQQNRAVKILFNKDYYIRTKILQKDLDILLIQYIYRLSIAKFAYKQKNGLLADIFRDLFTENNQVHSHNTRQKNNIRLNHTINKYGKVTTKQQSSNIWNSISTKIRKAKTVKHLAGK